ncbi:hypothetical protein Stsp02_31550 [Streptomyces sp. NBRC 14336]|uniref:DUF5134 domain-containing protein n=1 Tax=Streptomyces TaxID=1883 RepID=UPI0024A12841|nr:DUF5134 domain-containing protein [Streptomyces sp. NBRC 14336]GLW47493.1 hypothetical protein Stsp02_31550 [Streptomyces sp. NBRC 14336]
MGSPALTWSLVAVSVLVAMVSLARLAAADSREVRFAAGGDLVMAGGMAAMFLPATSASFGDHGALWVTVFAAIGLGGIVLSVRHTRRHGWRRGRHWAHHIIGSAAMVIMTLAMPGSTSGPVLALGTSGHGHGHGHGTANTEGAPEAMDAAGMAGMDHSMTGMSGAGHSGMAGHDMASASTQAAASSGSASLWRLVLIGLAVYFALSIAASLWTRFRSADQSAAAAGRRSGRSRWMRHALALPDAVVVFIASLAISVWDRTRLRSEKHRSHVAAGGRRRRRAPGTSPGAALLAHIGMGSTMSAMLVMMAA